MDPEVGGSIPPTNFSHIRYQMVDPRGFYLRSMGSSPICDKSPHYEASASGECVGVTRSNYSPVAT